jgi:surface antigen
MLKSMIVAIVLVAAALALTVPSMTTHAQINPFGRSEFELSQSDIEKLTAAAEPLYKNEDTPVDTVNEWRNEETGNYGTVALIEKHEYNGLPCRRLRHDIWLEKTQRTYRYIVDRCKVEDGAWKSL